MKTAGAFLSRHGSPLGRGLKILTILASAGLASLAAERADAAHAGHGAAANGVKEAVTSIAAKEDVDTTSSIEPKAAEDGTCSISRKRLFVEGEGWIVRRVTTCY